MTTRERCFDEMTGVDGVVRPPYQTLSAWLAETPPEVFERKSREARLLFERQGITFTAFGSEVGHETLIPFDIVPRVLSAAEWSRLHAGLVQRAQALNAFLDDAYHGREICRAGVIPEAEVVLNGQFAAVMQDLDLPRRIHAHILGIDLVRVDEGQFYVLEDNARVPSGVSYMIENREIMMRLFPRLFSTVSVLPVARYTDELLTTLQAAAPRTGDRAPLVVVLTPGPYNAAYFEHAFLADEMGVELVEGSDLLVDDNKVFMRTPQGPQRVDVIYRRVDDAFLDPLSFRPDSVLGVPGLVAAVRAGHVSLVNAIGNGIADDKATYIHVPEMIRFYLSEEPLLANVPTWRGARPDERAYIVEHLAEMVVKEIHGSGGKGMLVGPAATRAERDEFRARFLAHPDNYIAQPTLALSTCPTFVDSGLAPRHVDLRPFVLTGDEVRIVPGGLTRVALTDGSLVVNSSQGGGTKDTWVLAP